MFIRIVPVGNISQRLLEIIRAELRDTLNAKSRILTKIQVPEESFNHWRKQYNAGKIIELLSGTAEVKFIDKNIPTLMITDVDLYYEGLNFVFGLEEPAKSIAIVSIARLRPEFYDQHPNPTLLKERIVKEVIHEIGHYLGLEHCHNNWCVMSFSPSVQSVDIKKKYFCNECKIKMMTRKVNIE